MSEQRNSNHIGKLTGWAPSDDQLERGRIPTNVTPLSPNDINSGRIPTQITPLTPSGAPSQPAAPSTPPPNEQKA
jgi:hypothetical protein